MAMIGKIRRMHFRQGKSVREIVRLTSLSRNTVRKWLKTPLEGEPRYRRSVRPGRSDWSKVVGMEPGSAIEREQVA